MDVYEDECEDVEIERANRVCDEECRAVNGCGGHAACGKCGTVLCGTELSGNGLCDECEGDRHVCHWCGDAFFESENGCFEDEARHGLHFCSQECKDEYEEDGK